MGMDIVEYSHLDVRGRLHASKSSSERIKIISKDVWFECSQGAAIINLAKRYSSLSDVSPAPCNVIVGEGGYGKTSIIRQIEKRSKDWPGSVRFLSMSNNPGNLRFNELLLVALGLPRQAGSSRHKKELFPSELAKFIEHSGIKVLVIDEIHDAIGRNKTEQHHSLALLKALSEFPYCLSVIAFGTRLAGNALSLDEQLYRRYDPIVLRRWERGAEFTDFLHSWAVNLPLRNTTDVKDKALIKYILDQTNGEMDRVVKLIKWGAIQAVVGGEERLTKEVMARGLVERWGFRLDDD
ncbi:TniB family NTP-binding protein [Pseudomonas nitroreducens]|uniref:TniB family NTP-binding protein n=1 Tax=Pseudomonas nitroreducens TaxID=46680 RepID=UPI002D7EFEB8|nr:TniB family NTP-binding protein [Pseudomonas nitroreducens]